MLSFSADVGFRVLEATLDNMDNRLYFTLNEPTDTDFEGVLNFDAVSAASATVVVFFDVSLCGCV